MTIYIPWGSWSLFQFYNPLYKQVKAYKKRRQRQVARRAQHGVYFIIYVFRNLLFFIFYIPTFLLCLFCSCKKNSNMNKYNIHNLHNSTCNADTISYRRKAKQIANFSKKKQRIIFIWWRFTINNSLYIYRSKTKENPVQKGPI